MKSCDRKDTWIYPCVADDCTGCSACFAICHSGAVAMCADDRGFLHPVVDAQKCIRCGACLKVCPVRKRGSPAVPLVALAARAKDVELRAKSSSGGVFGVIARHVLRCGGVVFGAAWKDGLSVAHVGIDSEGDLPRLLTTKYVQSDVRNTFVDCRHALESNRLVLYSGTPCQIAGLKNFLGKPYANLRLLQIVCHAVPSPWVWNLYVNHCERKYQVTLLQASFRDKCTGWKDFSHTWNGGAFRESGVANSYAAAFFKHLSIRPSCTRCPARRLSSGADLTIGDCWGVESLAPEFDDDKGASIVVATSAAGEEMIESVKDEMDVVPVAYEWMAEHNPQISEDIDPNSKAEAFFKKLRAGEDFDEVVRNLTKPSMYRRFRFALGKWRKKLCGRVEV